MKGSTKSSDAPNTNYDVKVSRAKEIKEGIVAFDMIVNGVTIYGCWYREGKDKNGHDYQIISFPSHKGDNENYYNWVWFKIENDVKEDIIAQLQKLV